MNSFDWNSFTLWSHYGFANCWLSRISRIILSRHYLPPRSSAVLQLAFPVKYFPLFNLDEIFLRLVGGAELDLKYIGIQNLKDSFYDFYLLFVFLTISSRSLEMFSQTSMYWSTSLFVGTWAHFRKGLIKQNKLCNKV